MEERPSAREGCTVPKALVRPRLGSETTSVCFDIRSSNISMEGNQRETGDGETSMKWAKDLEMKGQEGEKRQSYMVT